MDSAQPIVRVRGICGGLPTMRGTRVPLRTVLASLAEGHTSEEIREACPTLTSEHIRAAIAFAATNVMPTNPTSQS